MSHSRKTTSKSPVTATGSQGSRRIGIAVAVGAIAVVVITLLVRPLFAGTVQASPVLIQLGPFSVRWYGALIALSFIPAYYLSAGEAKRKGIAPDHLLDMLVIAVPMAFLGARLAFVAQNLSFYMQNPDRILAIWEGGLSIHGVMIFGTAALYIYAKRTGISLLRLLDVSAPSVLLAQGIGRWGNFFNQELFGYPTDVPWKMFIRPENRPPAYMNESFFHPTFLYESLWNLAAVAFIVWWRRRPESRDGDGLGLYLILYSIGRFWVEFFRIGSEAVPGLTLAQVVSLLLVALGAGIMWAQRRHEHATA